MQAFQTLALAGRFLDDLCNRHIVKLLCAQKHGKRLPHNKFVFKPSVANGAMRRNVMYMYIYRAITKHH